MWDNHSVYIFNTSRIQYEDNRDDKHVGFEILRKIDINNVTNGEQREIESLTDTDIQSPNKIIVEFKSEQDNNQSGGSTPTGSTTAMETDEWISKQIETHNPVEGEILEQALKMSKKR